MKITPYPFIYSPLKGIDTCQYTKEKCYMECYPYNGEKVVEYPFPYLVEERSMYPYIDKLIEGDNMKLERIDMKY